ncbi:hypothetical protein SO802_022433 [Lithocarpus litseifolius]|uniref:Uncharacterized protein n=1 Tax=Lithocarpus litseifolius TaxID=425828 RepID=A0AAW2CJM4_9ROSI
MTWRKWDLKKMEDAVLRQHGEERVGWIVDDCSGEQTARRGDERRQAILSLGFLEERWENVLEGLEREVALLKRERSAWLKRERSSSSSGRGIGTEG